MKGLLSRYMGPSQITGAHEVYRSPVYRNKGVPVPADSIKARYIHTYKMDPHLQSSALSRMQSCTSSRSESSPPSRAGTYHCSRLGKSRRHCLRISESFLSSTCSWKSGLPWGRSHRWYMSSTSDGSTIQGRSCGIHPAWLNNMDEMKCMESTPRNLNMRSHIEKYVLQSCVHSTRFSNSSECGCLLYNT